MRMPNYRSYLMAHLGFLAYDKIKFESHSNNFKTFRKEHYLGMVPFKCKNFISGSFLFFFHVFI